MADVIGFVRLSHTEHYLQYCSGDPSSFRNLLILHARGFITYELRTGWLPGAGDAISMTSVFNRETLSLFPVFPDKHCSATDLIDDVVLCLKWTDFVYPESAGPHLDGKPGMVWHPVAVITQSDVVLSNFHRHSGYSHD